MPCYQRREIKVKWGQHTDLKILGKSLEAMGYKVQVLRDGLNYRYGFYTGTFTQKEGAFVQDAAMSAIDTKALTNEYNRQNVIEHAEQNGWQWEFNEDRSEIHITQDT